MWQKGTGEGRTRVHLINKWMDKRRGVMTEGHRVWRRDSVNEGGGLKGSKGEGKGGRGVLCLCDARRRRLWGGRLLRTQ